MRTHFSGRGYVVHGRLSVAMKISALIVVALVAVACGTPTGTVIAEAVAPTPTAAAARDSGTASTTTFRPAPVEISIMWGVPCVMQFQRDVSADQFYLDVRYCSSAVANGRLSGEVTVRADLASSDTTARFTQYLGVFGSSGCRQSRLSWPAHDPATGKPTTYDFFTLIAQAHHHSASARCAISPLPVGN